MAGGDLNLKFATRISKSWTTDTCAVQGSTRLWVEQALAFCKPEAKCRLKVFLVESCTDLSVFVALCN